MKKVIKYSELIKRIDLLIEGEDDTISIMSTICCEIFHSFEYFNWVGFYRLVDKSTLKVGPYQGTHGCLTININSGVCGKCVREENIQIENDVTKLPHHITCSSDTKSEIIIPVFNNNNKIKSVLDIDSIELNSFDEIDNKYLVEISNKIYFR